MSMNKHSYFKQWRGSNALKEQKFFETTLLLDDYVAHSDLKKIQHDLHHSKNGSSLAFARIIQTPHWRKSLLLYLALDLLELSDAVSNAKEHVIIHTLQKDFASLYHDHMKETAKKVTSIMTQTADFLSIESTDFLDKSQGKKVLNTLYLGFRFVDRSLPRISPFFKVLATLSGLDLVQTGISIKQLIQQIEDKIMSLELLISESPADAVTHPSTEQALKHEKPETPCEEKVVAHEIHQIPVSPQKSELDLLEHKIQAILNQNYIAIIQQDELDNTNKLHRLKTTSDTLKNHLTQLMHAQQHYQGLMLKRKKIALLLDELLHNDEKEWGRVYFLELIADEEEAFALLLTESSGATKEALLYNLKQQQQTDLVRSIGRIAAWISTPLIVASRLTMNKTFMNSVLNKLPETLDSEAKKLSIQLAKEQLAVFDLQAQAAQEQIEQTRAALADNHPELLHLLSQVDEKILTALLSKNTINAMDSDLLLVLEIFEEEMLIKHTQAIEIGTIKIQQSMSQQYVDLLNTADDEQSKVAMLIEYMNKTVTNLHTLIAIKKRREVLVTQYNQLTVLKQLMEYNETNPTLAQLIQERLNARHQSLAAIDKELTYFVDTVFSNSNIAPIDLLSCTAKELHRIAAENTVAESVQAALLQLVPPIPVASADEEGEQTIQDYFNARHLSCLYNETQEEDLRLNTIQSSINDIQPKIMQLLSVRQEYEQVIDQEKQINTVLYALQQHPKNHLLSHLIQSRAQALNAREKQLKIKAEHLARQLSDGHPAFSQLLLHGNPQHLVAVCDTHRIVAQCIEQYRLLKQKIILLAQMKHGVQVLTHYMTEHRTWWVRLTDYLARFCSLFKSEAGIMIDTANQLKEELRECMVSCQKEITIDMDIIEKEPNIGEALLGDLPTQQAYKTQENNNTLFDDKRIRDLLQHVSLFKRTSAKNAQEQQHTHSLEVQREPKASFYGS